jgi:hypothetical protein
VPHVPPPLPHAPCRLPASHISPLQHPVGQPTPSHTHAPPRQCWPDTHAWPVPHAHAPLSLQLSARTSLHAVQSLPPAPHVMKPGESQVPSAAQHPFGHDEALHLQTPLMQTWPTPQGAVAPHAHSPFVQESAVPAAQTLQVAPACPQDESESGVHVVPTQQSSGHDARSHTQSPPTHSWPPPHAAPPPHVHCPVGPHASDFAASHATQTFPPTPHVAAMDALHSVPEQQPAGQLVAQPEQTPPEHVSPPPQSVQR